jgi:hypothetical protein
MPWQDSMERRMVRLQSMTWVGDLAFIASATGLCVALLIQLHVAPTQLIAFRLWQATPAF